MPFSAKFSLAFAFFALLFASSVYVTEAQPPAKATTKQKFGSHNVVAKIEGPAPDERIEPGDLIVLDGSGSVNAQTFKWVLANSNKRFLEVEGRSKVVFASGTAGQFKFFLAAAGLDEEGKAADLSVAEFVVTVGTPTPEPIPVPTPTPGPIPPPPTPPPAPTPPVPGTRLAVFLLESSAQTPAVATVVRDMRQGAAEKWLKDNKHFFYVCDESNPSFASWRSTAGTLTRPVLLICNADGNVLYKDTLGTKTAADIIELIKKYGG